ncbi:hypothetical protein BH09ACT7_BH09ACT7_25140 [soil metagenome]
MSHSLVTIGRLAAGALLIAGAGISGLGTASADPDYSALLIHPNNVTDSNAYSAGPPIQDPNGQPGVQAVYTHRDGSRTITDTVLVLSDPEAATAAMNASQASSGIANQTSVPAPVGTGGTLVSGTSADGTQSVSLLLFTQGNTATTVEFEGVTSDPAPADLAIDFGQRQDTAIKDWQATLG